MADIDCGGCDCAGCDCGDSGCAGNTCATCCDAATSSDCGPSGSGDDRRTSAASAEERRKPATKRSEMDDESLREIDHGADGHGDR